MHKVCQAILQRPKSNLQSVLQLAIYLGAVLGLVSIFVQFYQSELYFQAQYSLTDENGNSSDRLILSKRSNSPSSEVESLRTTNFRLVTTIQVIILVQYAI